MKRVGYILVVCFAAFISISSVHAEAINDDCTKDNSCKMVCNYTLTYDEGYKSKEDGSQKITTKNVTIYSLNNSDQVIVKWNTNSGVLTAKGTLGTGGLRRNNGTYTPAFWKSSKTGVIKDSSGCPANAYIGEKKHVIGFNSFDSLCFDDDGKSCKEVPDYNFDNNGKLVTKNNNNNNKNENIHINMNFTVGACDSILGNPKFVPGADYQSPAYYLQFAFKLLKYATIILLFAFTVAEFAKAVVSNNQDAIQKALSNTIKRIVIAIVVFFLPILVEFLLQLLGIYSASNCGIS